ncbi:hypothetical protein ABID08_005538 [Rhizobium binae]|uniref:Uncharacterized protein n=1 Tax=Rhizobium binae TaxID=1138190 RepID=A0ABV2MP25_9HYPH|nr:hypothetical protein [Rhizobium binae]MBX4995304.1 hypothetical protein [Rhizobium binae]NKL51763.1 hypothetical protein [Rhizobium leguminosarum bv. viciae]QSY85479.1 hypothetical protein J2J99_28235 [Rhizobium binae]
MSLGYFSSDEVDTLLDEFGGLQGAIRLKHYISAAEILAWNMAKSSVQDMCNFLQEYNGLMAEHGEFMYYFVQAIVDQMSTMGNDVRPIIGASPERYQQFLKRRFLGNNQSVATD